MTDVTPAPADPTFAETATALMEQLVAMDALAKSQGTSLVDVLCQAARSQSGVDIRPADKLADEPAL